MMVAATVAPSNIGLPTDSLSPSETINTLSRTMAEPISPEMISTFKVSPVMTRYCLPPVLMTAYITTSFECGFAKARIIQKNPAPSKSFCLKTYYLKRLRHPFCLAAHGVEELGVVLGRLDLAQQEFHRFQFVHRVEQFAQYPNFLQHIGLDQQLFLARAGTIDVD